MNNVQYIKADYGNPEYQEDLRADSIFLLTKNMVANFYRFNNRFMTVSEINKLLMIFNDRMIIENELNTFNQTS